MKVGTLFSFYARTTAASNISTITAILFYILF